MDFENVKDVLGARLVMLLEREELEPGEVMIAKTALMQVFRDGGAELMTALENAMWMDKTIAEDEQQPSAYAAAGDKAWAAHVQSRKVREGVDNDGLTDAEATAALDEQTTWPQDEFGREIDPALLDVNTTKNNIAMFAKVNGTWRFEGLMGEAHSVISQPVAEFRSMVEAENGPGTAFVVKLPS